MGMRLGANLAKTDEFETMHVEVSEAGQAAVREAYGIDCVDVDIALDGADIIVLAVPDTVIGKVAHGIIDKVKSGAVIFVLDGAAPFAGHLPERADITYFMSHQFFLFVFNSIFLTVISLPFSFSHSSGITRCAH